MVAEDEHDLRVLGADPLQSHPEAVVADERDVPCQNEDIYMRGVEPFDEPLPLVRVEFQMQVAE